MRNAKKVIVTFPPRAGWKKPVQEILGEIAEIFFLEDLDSCERKEHLTRADALLSFMIQNELKKEEISLLPEKTMIQTLLAGVDAVPFEILPKSSIICANTGAWAEPMAEYVVGMMFALGKNLVKCHKKLAQGEFRREANNVWFQGKTVGIVGFGGIGRATARLMKAFGMKIMAINTRGTTTESVDFIGTMKDLDRLLEQADVLVLSIPLTRSTKGLIGERELELMKPSAILINPARGFLIDEKALYEHMIKYPNFKVGIDAWWIEPDTHGEFRLHYPFFELENFLGSPHQAPTVPEIYPLGVRRAAENIRRFLTGKKPTGIIDPADYETD